MAIGSGAVKKIGFRVGQCCVTLIQLPLIRINLDSTCTRAHEQWRKELTACSSMSYLVSDIGPFLEIQSFGGFLSSILPMLCVRKNATA